MLVLLKCGFSLNFHVTGVNLFLRTIFMVWIFFNGFIVLDAYYISHNVSFSLFTSSLSDNNVNVWHVGLDHICQDRMNRLTKKVLLGNINKIDLAICEHYLARKKKTKKTIWKRN